MKKILNFYQTHKIAIKWTLCYIAVMWTILYGLFNFNMFNGAQWNHLFHAQLRGFPGFVFGILILAALPLYVATTTLVVRKKQALITVPVPARIKKLFTKPAAPPTASGPDTPVEKTPEPEPLPSEIPSELRPHFVRSRILMAAAGTTYINMPYGSQNQSQTTPTPATESPQNDDQLSDLPLPSDFDISTPDNDMEQTTDEAPVFGAPTFTDINFDTTTPTTNNPVCDYLTANNIQFEIDNDVIITNKHAIATHTDPEFWIADEDTWFAAGEKRPSPINKILDIAKSKNLIPVMYLGATNIMDLDKNTELWTTMGISVITSPDQLPK